jgi:hypothetical protein
MPTTYWAVPLEVTMVDGHLSLVPGHDEVFESFDQRHLLEKIWNGCQNYLIHNENEIVSSLCQWEYMIDLDNRMIETKGVFQHQSNFKFDELKEGMFDGWIGHANSARSEEPGLVAGTNRQPPELGVSGVGAGMRGKEKEQDGKGTEEPSSEDEWEDWMTQSSSTTSAWLEAIWRDKPNDDRKWMRNEDIVLIVQRALSRGADEEALLSIRRFIFDEPDANLMTFVHWLHLGEPDDGSIG